MSQIPLINRNAILIGYKRPFLDWIKRVDPNPEELEGYEQEENSVYLLPEFGNDNEMWGILKDRYDDIFLNEVSSWYKDKNLWPKDRTFEMFKKWFNVNAHTMIYDIVDGKIKKERT